MGGAVREDGSLISRELLHRKAAIALPTNSRAVDNGAADANAPIYLSGDANRTRRAPAGLRIEIGRIDCFSNPGDRFLHRPGLSASRGTACRGVAVRRPVRRSPMGEGGSRAHPPIYMCLIADADAEAGEGAVEAAVFGFARVDARIDGVEEHVGAIAEADFGIGIAQRQPRKAAEIRH